VLVGQKSRPEVGRGTQAGRWGGKVDALCWWGGRSCRCAWVKGCIGLVLSWLGLTRCLSLKSQGCDCLRCFAFAVPPLQPSWLCCVFLQIAPAVSLQPGLLCCVCEKVAFTVCWTGSRCNPVCCTLCVSATAPRRVCLCVCMCVCVRAASLHKCWRNMHHVWQ